MDQHALRELHLYMENDGDVHRRLTRDFIPNLDKKAKAGKYDRAKAPKLFLYLVDFGAEKYLKEFGDVESGARPRDPTAIKRAARRMFPTALRVKLSEMLRDEYEEEAKERGVDLGFCDTCSHSQTPRTASTSHILHETSSKVAAQKWLEMERYFPIQHKFIPSSLHRLELGHGSEWKSESGRKVRLLHSGMRWLVESD